jgi:uncharacterized SAM-binding protein YcdF (DUF218 family)
MGPRRWLRIAVRGGLVAFALLVVYLVVTFVQVWSASRHDGARKADAIIVMGAAQYNGVPSRVLKERLDHALVLYKQGFAEKVVVTGGRQAGDKFTEATAGYNYLRSSGVPADAILKEVSGANTFESLAATSVFLKRAGTIKVVLVSDGYHALRLEAIADELGLDASVSPSGSASLSRFGKVKAFTRETAAVAVGRVIGFRALDSAKSKVSSGG